MAHTYVFADEFGITPSDVPKTVLPRGKCITNGLVLDLFSMRIENPDITPEVVCRFLNIHSSYKDHLSARLSKLNKQRKMKRGKYLQILLNTTFELPHEGCSKQPQTVITELRTSSERQKQELDNLKGEQKHLKRKVFQLKESRGEKRQKVTELKEKVKTFAKETVKLEKEMLKCKFDKAKETSSLRSSQSSLETEVAQLSKHVSSVETTKASLETQVVTLMEERTAMKLELKKKSDEISDLLKRNEELKTNCTYLEQTIEDIQSNHLELYDADTRMFKPETELCVYQLLNYKVAFDNVSAVITSVASLCGKTNIDRLPKESTVRNWNTRRLGLSQMQAAEILPEAETLTLYTDETSKRGDKFGGYHVSDEEGNMWVLGLRNMANKSSKTTLDTFKMVLSDIDRSLEKTSKESEGDHQNTGHQILSKVRCTMSDQAATEKHFNDLLSQYRSEILPEVTANWQNFTEEQKAACAKMYNFFCGLHLLVNLAELTNTTLKKFESSLDMTDTGAASLPETTMFTKKTEAGTVRYVRTACKAFTKGGDEKSGAYRAFADHIEEQRDEILRFAPFHGNRFNILFVDGGLVYYYSKDITEFIGEVHGKTNTLLTAVYADSKVPAFLAGTKVLGLIEKQVTSPLWRVIEAKGHILDMNQHYFRLLTFLREASVDSSAFLAGKEVPFPDHVRHDKVLEYLLAESDVDAICQQMLQFLFTAWITYIEKAVKDHLPGGDHEKVSAEMRTLTQSTLKHNKFPESIFGLLDHLLTVRPNATTLCNEAYIMFLKNKTFDWIDSKPKEERNDLIKKCHTLTREIKKEFKLRCDDITETRKKAQKEKKLQLQRKRQRELQEKEKLTSDIIYYGLWQSEEEIHVNVRDLMKNKQECRKALCAQLSFRKNVLNQEHHDRSIFNTTRRNNVSLTIQDLEKNLGELVRASLISPNKDERHLVGHPLLVGKTIKHTFKDSDESDTYTDYTGHVISTVPGHSAWYNVTYENDSAVYTYQLQDYYADGSLKIHVGKISMAWRYLIWNDHEDSGEHLLPQESGSMWPGWHIVL